MEISSAPKHTPATTRSVPGSTAPAVITAVALPLPVTSYDQQPCQIELPPGPPRGERESAPKRWRPLAEDLHTKSDIWTGAGHGTGFVAGLLLGAAGYWFASKSKKPQVLRGARHGLYAAGLLTVGPQLLSILGVALARSNGGVLLLGLLFLLLAILGLLVVQAIHFAIFDFVFRHARKAMYPIAIVTINLAVAAWRIGPELFGLFLGWASVAISFAAFSRSNEIALCRLYLPRARIAIDGSVSWIPFFLGFALPPLVLALLMSLPSH